MAARTAAAFPPLPYEEWCETKTTLHLFAQIVGKVRLATSSPRNHWWHVPFYVASRGLTTGPLEHGERLFSLDFDLVDHTLRLNVSDGLAAAVPLRGMSVAGFYERVMTLLATNGLAVEITETPFGIPITDPFPTDERHAAYDPEYVSRFFTVLARADSMLKEFSGRFVGKTSPVHLFWHSFDLAVTRFSGRRAPEAEGVDPVTREAYSHEVVSFGFWAGDENVAAPAFYSYAAPEPDGLTAQPLRPDAARWVTQGTGSLALLMYDDIRELADPRGAVLDFLESAYQAGARLAGWDVKGLTRLTERWTPPA